MKEKIMKFVSAIRNHLGRTVFVLLMAIGASLLIANYVPRVQVCAGIRYQAASLSIKPAGCDENNNATFRYNGNTTLKMKVSLVPGPAVYEGTDITVYSSASVLDKQGTIPSDVNCNANQIDWFSDDDRQSDFQFQPFTNTAVKAVCKFDQLHVSISTNVKILVFPKQ